MLPARLALPPHLGASVRLLRDCFLDEAADVRQAGVGSARTGTARLDRRRVRVQANDAHALVRLNHAGGVATFPVASKGF